MAVGATSSESSSELESPARMISSSLSPPRLRFLRLAPVAVPFLGREAVPADILAGFFGLDARDEGLAAGTMEDDDGEGSWICEGGGVWVTGGSVPDGFGAILTRPGEFMVVGAVVVLGVWFVWVG